MQAIEGRVWGNRSRDLRGMVERLAQKYELRLTITGINSGWITKTIDFEAHGDETSLREFQREALALMDP